ncbi:Helix-turn-helix motif [hydrothermal vent metagenome]|uniref:Helix-turn-helix motif n=1 Tax=hydrothermal vent metagenome TaxID=652676 RepID=A0A3B0ZU31_9ZZZZ
MNIKPIKSETDYDAALERVAELMDAKENTPEGDELDVLTTLVEAFESKHYPIHAPDPIEAILFRMDQNGLKDKDLIPFIGQSGRVSEVLNYSRKLTLPMIRRLHAGLNIPTESLIQEYELKFE